MLTSFFSKSKPINFVFVAVYMAVFYGIADFWGAHNPAFGSVLQEIGMLVVFLLSMLVLNYIAETNELTKRSAYKIILFAAFSCMLFEIPRNNGVLISNLFVLLSLRSIFTLKNQREMKRKIFDATLWIGLASLFYFWSILFLLLLFFGIFMYARQEIRNWFVPLTAFMAVFSIVTSFYLLFFDRFFSFGDWYQESSFYFFAYSNLGILIPVSFLLGLTIWSLFFFLNIMQKVSGNIKASLGLVLLSLFVALAVAFFAPTKNSSELLFFLGPLSIVVTNYLERIDDNWFRETLLVLIVSMPIVPLFFY